MTSTHRYIIVGSILAVSLFLIWFFSAIIGYILAAYVLSLIGHPLIQLLEKITICNKRIPRNLSAAITLFVLLALVYYFLKFFIPLIISQFEFFTTIDFNKVVLSMQEPLQKLEKFINKWNISGTPFSINNYILERAKAIVNAAQIMVFFDSVTSIISHLFIAILATSFITFYFLRDDELFGEALILFVPTEHETRVTNILKSIKLLLSRYFVGICIESLLIIILISLGFKLIGFAWNVCFLVGLVAGILNVIPYLGPLISTCFGLSIGLITHLQYNFSFGLNSLFWYIILVYVIVKIIDDVLFQPYIYSSSVNAHPLEIFIVILIAANIGGVLGMLLAVPSYTIIRVIAKEFFSKFKLVKKITENI